VETVAFCGICHNSAGGPMGEWFQAWSWAGGRVLVQNELRIVLP